MSNGRITLSKWSYLVACFMVLGGIGSFSWLLVKDITSMTKGLTQIILPGSAEVELSAAGQYTVFYESESMVGNRVFSTPSSLHGVECQLVSKETGALIPLNRPTMSTTYTLGGRSGQSVLSFHVTKPGAYIFTASVPDNRKQDSFVFALGPDTSAFFAGILLTAIGSLFILKGGGALLGVLTFVRRREAKKRLIATGSTGSSPATVVRP